MWRGITPEEALLVRRVSSLGSGHDRGRESSSYEDETLRVASGGKRLGRGFAVSDATVGAGVCSQDSLYFL
jgi:hypothetical protein